LKSARGLDEKSKRFRTLVVLLLVALILAGAALIQHSVDTEVKGTAGWEESSPIDAGRSILDLLGGVRETLAAYFWTKTDTVFHEYYGADPEKTLRIYPYYWLITRLDPHFTMAYYYATWMLCRSGRVEEGLDLALEGVRNNPDSHTLQENLSQIYFFFKKDPARARYHCLKAISLAHDEEERSILRNFLHVIDRALAGEISIPELPSFEHLRKVGGELEEHDHGHEHSE